MNKFTRIIMFFLGYNRTFTENEQPPSPITIQIEGLDIRETVKKSNKCKSISLKLLFYLYNIVILGLTSWKLIHTFIKIILFDEFKLTNEVFQLLVVTQYMFGISYFRTKNFYNKCSDDESVAKRFNIATFISAFVSVIATVLMMMYNFVWNHSDDNILSIILRAFGTLYGYLALGINLSAFISIIMFHDGEITRFSKSLEADVNGTNLAIIDIYKTISGLREQQKNTILKWNLFFTSFTLLGIINTVLFVINTIKTKEFRDVSSIINNLVFICVEILYFVLIIKFEKNMQDVNYYIVSEQMITKYFPKDRQTTVNIPKISGLNPIYENVLGSPSMSPPATPTATTTPSNTTNLVQRGSSLHRASPTIEIENENNSEAGSVDAIGSIGQIDMLKKIKNDVHNILIYSANTNEIATRSLLKMNEIQTLQEWVMLRDLVNEKWRHFSLLGFEIRNADTIKKFVGIAIFISSLYDINKLTSIINV